IARYDVAERTVSVLVARCEDVRHSAMVVANLHRGPQRRQYRALLVRQLRVPSECPHAVRRIEKAAQRRRRTEARSTDPEQEGEKNQRGTETSDVHAASSVRRPSRARWTRKVEPSPGALSKVISYPSASQSDRAMDKPRPVPPYARLVVESACSKGSKIAR